MIHNYHAERYECGRRTSRKMHRQNSSIHSIYISIIFFCADRFWLNLLMSLFYSIAFIAHTPHTTQHTPTGAIEHEHYFNAYFSLCFFCCCCHYMSCCCCWRMHSKSFSYQSKCWIFHWGSKFLTKIFNFLAIALLLLQIIK